MGWDSPAVDTSSRALAASAEKLEREYAEWAQRYDAPAGRPMTPRSSGGVSGDKGHEGDAAYEAEAPSKYTPSYHGQRGLALQPTSLRDDGGQFRVSVSSLDSEEEDFNKFCERVAATISSGGGATRTHDVQASSHTFQESFIKKEVMDGKGGDNSVEVRVLLENAEQHGSNKAQQIRNETESYTDYFRTKERNEFPASSTQPPNVTGQLSRPATNAKLVDYFSDYTPAENNSPESATPVEDFLHSASPPVRRSPTDWRSAPLSDNGRATNSADPLHSSPATQNAPSNDRWSMRKMLSGDDNGSPSNSADGGFGGQTALVHSGGDSHDKLELGARRSPRGSSGSGWALQNIAKEERALEEELEGINAQLLDKPSRGVKDLATETIAEVDSVLSGTAAQLSHASNNPPYYQAGVQHAGDPEWWPRYRSSDHRVDEGPKEYNPRQARSEEMYVPVGRGSAARAVSPRPSRARSPSPPHGHASAHNRRGDVDIGGLNVSSGRLSRSGSSGPYEWVDGRPQPAQPGREELDNRIADRMYRHAVEINNRKEFARRTATQEAQEAALQGCTFKPAINRRSVELAKSTPRYGAQRDESALYQELEEHNYQIHGAPVRREHDVSPRGRATSAPRERAGSRQGRQSAPTTRKGGAVRRGPSNTVHSRGWEAYDFQRRGEGGEVQFRGFECARGTPDYEAELAASVEAARRAMQAGMSVEDLSSPWPSVGDVGKYAYAEAGAGADEWRGVDDVPMVRESDVAVTRACHRLYDQGLAQREKLQEKRRRAREQEQTLARSALESIKSRAASPGPRLTTGGGRQGSPYRSPRGASYRSPERVPPRVPQRQQQRSRPQSAPHQRPAWVPGNGKVRDAQGAITSNQRLQSPTRSRSPSKAESFAEFLQRQSEFVNKKEAKVKAAKQAAAVKPAPPVSEGSRKILRQQQATARIIQEEIDALVGGYDGERPQGVTEVNYLADTASSAQRSPTPKTSASTMTFMQRLELAMQGGAPAQASSKLGVSSSRAPPVVEPQRVEPRAEYAPLLNPECTFKPRITRKGAVRKARSPAEMSEGDRLRREAWREEQIRERKERELEGVTFSPKTGITGHYSDVQSRLCLGRPNVYMEYLEHRAQEQEAKAAVHRARRTEEEVAECTFAPQVSPRAPPYVERLARSHAARAAAGLFTSGDAAPEVSWR